jgi:hypothetical protein
MKHTARKLLIICAIMLAACTEPNTARRVLDSAGYTDIHFTGYSWFACSSDDTYHTGFTAKGPTGKAVSGTVCTGVLFKNSTIRFE